MYYLYSIYINIQHIYRYVSWMLLEVTLYDSKNRRQSSETAPQKQTKGRSKPAVEAECCLQIILASKIGANSSHSVLVPGPGVSFLPI